MSAYTLTQQEYRNLKSRLTRAKNSGDPRKVIEEVNRAEAVFEDKGWPDEWSRWTRAREDAQWELRHTGRL